MLYSVAPKARIVDTPVVIDVKCSRISAVGPASARFTIERALIYARLIFAHQRRRRAVRKLVYMEV